MASHASLVQKVDDTAKTCMSTGRDAIFDNAASRKDFAKVLIHAADLYNPLKPVPVASLWAKVFHFTYVHLVPRLKVGTPNIIIFFTPNIIIIFTPINIVKA